MCLIIIVSDLAPTYYPKMSDESDDKVPIVIDNGTSMIRAGFAYEKNYFSMETS